MEREAGRGGGSMVGDVGGPRAASGPGHVAGGGVVQE